MGWGDVAAAVSGALTGGFNAYEQQREEKMAMAKLNLQEQVAQLRAFMQGLGFKSREKIAEQNNDTKVTIADKNNATRSDIADRNNATRTGIADQNNQTRRDIVGEQLGAAWDRAKLGADTTRRGQDLSLEGRKYAADTAADSSRYRTDTGAAVTQRGQNLNYQRGMAGVKARVQNPFAVLFAPPGQTGTTAPPAGSASWLDDFASTLPASVQDTTPVKPSPMPGPRPVGQGATPDAGAAAKKPSAMPAPKPSKGPTPSASPSAADLEQQIGSLTTQFKATKDPAAQGQLREQIRRLLQRYDQITGKPGGE